MGNKKINFVPFILLFVMIFSIGGSFLFNYLNKIYGTFYWAKFIFNFVACELIIFHITPPFATLITFIVVNTNKKYYDSFWFRLHVFEKKLYKKINVKKLKEKIVSYDDRLFSAKNDLLIIVRNMTQSEIVHEMIFLTSFVPIFLKGFFPHTVVVGILCFFFAILHLPFIIVQRFNRPRVLKLMKK